MQSQDSMSAKRKEKKANADNLRRVAGNLPNLYIYPNGLEKFLTIILS
jgi:hypothetical protein